MLLFFPSLWTVSGALRYSISPANAAVFERPERQAEASTSPSRAAVELRPGLLVRNVPGTICSAPSDCSTGEDVASILASSLHADTFSGRI